MNVHCPGNFKATIAAEYYYDRIRALGILFDGLDNRLGSPRFINTLQSKKGYIHKIAFALGSSSPSHSIAYGMKKHFKKYCNNLGFESSIS